MSDEQRADVTILPAGPEESADAMPDELAVLTGGHGAKYTRFVLAALGSIPWVGGFLGAVAAVSAENAQGRVNDLLLQWLEEHRQRLGDLERALARIVERLEQLGPDVEERVAEKGYLTLVRLGFRAWDQAATSEKRKLVEDLLANAGGTRITSDDLVRLFIEWIERYHEVHFAIIRAVFKNPGATRRDIASALYASLPRDDSAEADLFRLLIDDLSRGRVIRQHRETTSDGRFIKKDRTRASASSTMKSAFDDEEPYELTALGEQFVHYTMNEIVPRIGGA